MVVVVSLLLDAAQLCVVVTRGGTELSLHLPELCSHPSCVAICSSLSQSSQGFQPRAPSRIYTYTKAKVWSFAAVSCTSYACFLL